MANQGQGIGNLPPGPPLGPPPFVINPNFGANVPAAQPAAQPVAFAVTPNMAHHNVLNFRDKNNIDIYTRGAEPLPEKFDLQSANLRTFLKHISDKVRIMGWDHLVGIPVDLADPLGPTNSLILSYGQISLDRVRAHAATYVTTQSRACQDSMQLYECLTKSLTQAAVAVINLYQADYTVQNTVSGAALLRVIICQSHVDTTATEMSICTNLTHLPDYMVKISSDIEQFN